MNSGLGVVLRLAALAITVAPLPQPDGRGYDDSRRWGDVNGDSKADYCRIVGSGIYSSTNLRCTLSTGTGFGLTFTSPTLDAGYGGTGTWADVTGDGRDDYCRAIGGYRGSCTVSTGSGFGATFTTPIGSLDQLGWADFNRDGKVDLCRWEAGAPGARCRTGPHSASPTADRQLKERSRAGALRRGTSH